MVFCVRISSAQWNDVQDSQRIILRLLRVSDGDCLASTRACPVMPKMHRIHEINELDKGTCFHLGLICKPKLLRSLLGR